MNEVYQVFISFKNKDFEGNPSEDSRVAEKLYEELMNHGISAFFSNVKLLELGSAAYKSSIEKAIDSANVMIVIGSCPEFLETE